jgi:hypothetical protein
MTPLSETWRYVDCGAVRIVSIFEAPDVHQADTTTGVTTDDLLAALGNAVENSQEARA